MSSRLFKAVLVVAITLSVLPAPEANAGWTTCEAYVRCTLPDGGESECQVDSPGWCVKG